jgi:phage shock protein A
MSLGRRLSELLGRRRADDDPLAALETAYRSQAEHLQASRRGVADVVTAARRVELQVRGLEQSARQLHAQAQTAVDAGREDEARALLSRRAALLEQAAALQPDLDRLRAQEERLTAQVQRLEAKVEAFRAQKEAVSAGASAAEAHLRIGEAFAGVAEEGDDVGLALARARQRTDALQARADAVEALAAGGAAALPWQTPGERSEQELAALQADGVEAELARLRRPAAPGERAAEQAR